ncbi:MAG TPA: NTP transferase domain-containing protein, partial [Rhodothermales bacterium]|nr:NTP transferase domain-containing protein [Rhodothermales bacterium]
MAGPAKNGSTSPRTGVILAAGFGSRLAGVDASTRLKPLTPVAGTPLIVRTLRSLKRAGCQRVVIVLGYKPEVMQAGIESVYEGPLDL